jgi:hypothetical protein
MLFPKDVMHGIRKREKRTNHVSGSDAPNSVFVQMNGIRASEWLRVTSRKGGGLVGEQHGREGVSRLVLRSRLAKPRSGCGSILNSPIGMA